MRVLVEEQESFCPACLKPVKQALVDDQFVTLDPAERDDGRLPLHSLTCQGLHADHD